MKLDEFKKKAGIKDIANHLNMKQSKWLNENMFKYSVDIYSKFQILVDVVSGDVASITGSIYFEQNKLEIIESFPVKFGNCVAFSCRGMTKLKSLEGAPSKVSKDFNLNQCRNLKTLKGISKCIGRDLFLIGCESLESIDELKDVFVKGNIVCGYNDSLKNGYIDILKDKKLFKMWQKSSLSTDDFISEYSGFIEGKKYGI